MLMTIPEQFNELVEKALESYDYSVQKDLLGGKSGASVLLIDVDLKDGVPFGKLPPGQCILKLDEKKIYDPPEANESVRHQAAVARNKEFSDAHIPQLLSYHENANHTALFYNIAGGGLTNIVTAENIPARALEHQCGQLSRALLYQLNKLARNERNVSARTSLENWLGYRLDKNKAKRLHQFISDETNNLPIYKVRDRVLLNPLWLCNATVIAEDESFSRLTGLLHGDLNTRNILVSRENPHSERFWLIDFALSFEGPLFFDHAYLELSLLLRHLQRADSTRLLNIISELDAPASGGREVLIEDVGVLDCLKAVRGGVSEWQGTEYPNRLDTFRAQMLLARVAASINYVNKSSLTDHERRLALAYGAWSARSYLELFHQGEWDRVLSESDVRIRHATGATVAVDAVQERGRGSEDRWVRMWEEAGRFNERTAKYVFLTGALKDIPDLDGLGLIPWSLVIDFDPESDLGGLYAQAAPVLERLRSVSRFGLQPLPVDLNRGTAWVMANGWPSRHEPVPKSFREWRNTYGRVIRSLFELLKRAVSPHDIKVIVLQGGYLTGDRLERVLETADEELGELGQIILVSNETTADTSLIRAHVDLGQTDFVAGVRRTYGTGGEISDPELPGLYGPVSIEVERLRILEEDLEILHSEILASQVDQSDDLDAFWRGSPPTWSDLYADLDVRRSLHAGLVDTLKKLLDESRNQTLELHHSPGSGGTTAAYRAAWELHTEYPVAVLLRKSKLTLDRLDELFHRTQKPVLLVADASVLASTEREELYRGLNNRNARVVILYVIRKSRPDPSRKFTIIDPLDDAEAEKFRASFSERTSDDNKKSYLALISNDVRWRQYRSPFFYGLYVYEEQLSSIERYVEARLSEIGYQERRIMQYLALVSRYSQIPISEALFEKLLGPRPDTELNLERVMGSGPASLILKQDGHVKLLHPLLAKEVLKQLLGGKRWESTRYQLKALALDLIRDLVRILGPNAEELQELFGDLFIRRDDWFGTGHRGQFAELINDIPDRAGQHQVLMELRDSCPEKGYYWNHLGRHHIYRMKLDYAIAEEYLMNAVKLEPDDRTHYHSLGMVRRFWIAQRLRDIETGEGAPPVEDVLYLVEDLAEKAFEAFSEARRLDPEDNHGYITHIQVILNIAEKLVNASGAEDITRLSNEDGEVGAWLRHNLAVAEELLAEVRHLRAESKPSRYEIHCQTGLTDLYGDFNQVITTWESMLSTPSSEQEGIRRALATAYYARAKRDWSALSEVDLRRIIQLMESNLSVDATNNRDIRMWFQAYRRLPDFSYLQALGRLETWASSSDSLDANYYLYILHYLLWCNKTEPNEENILLYLERCINLSVGRRNQSYEWLGIRPTWCPLVQHNELGEFDRNTNFYPRKELLAFVSGTIETYKGPQAGTIRLGRSIRAFFVPGKKIWASDVNKEVHFYLGFSYSGFRAWSVEKGPSPIATPVHQHHWLGDREPVSPTFASPKSAGPRLSAPLLLATVEDRDPDVEILRGQVESFILDAAADSDKLGQELTVAGLGDKLNAKFPTQVYKRLGHNTLTDLLRTIPGIEREGEGVRVVIHRSGYKGKSFVPTADANPLNEKVKSYIVEVIKKSSGQEILLSQLGLALRNKFPGEAVYKQLGFRKLIDLLRELRDITITTAPEGGDDRVTLTRQSQAVRPTGQETKQATAGLPDRAIYNQVRAAILRLIDDAEKDGRDLFVSTLGYKLNVMFPGEPVYRRCGHLRLIDLLDSIKNLRIEGEGGRIIVKRVK